MTQEKSEARTCAGGHVYYKTSDCPTCPVCEQERKPRDGFLAQLSAPARRALAGEGITDLDKLSAHTEKEILKLHGIGPSSMPKLRQSLAEAGLSFKENTP
ncbi:RNA polymerase alpha subunit C-terminal domain-containing protein [Paenibacillus hubeiensis]|uniref:RNA polymerase alpha subunit C-terminal domain-containing protein n=1 Tax=Paenibacillus hubeiensis TaxID=3077330 RepID=UPI0031BB10E4